MNDDLPSMLWIQAFPSFPPARPRSTRPRICIRNGSPEWVNPGAIKTRMTINEPEILRNKLPHKPDIAGDTIAWLTAGRKEWLAGRYVSCPWDMGELLSRKDEIVVGDKLKMKMMM